MQKVITIILLILLLFLVFGCSSDVVSTCSRGEVNDSYPGQCGQYVDNNENQICDESEIS